MFSFFYDLLLGLYLAIRLFGLFFSKKKAHVLQKLKIPKITVPQGRKIVWVHSVSLGETKAAFSIIEKLKQENCFIIHSTVTDTGFQEALKNSADEHLFLPFDFSFLMKRLSSKITPDMLIFIETDFWYHFLRFMKKAGSKAVVLSGKLSKRSFERFNLLSFFAKKLFSFFDVIAVQNEVYQSRFQTFTNIKVEVSGNLKLFNQTPKFSSLEIDKLKAFLHLNSKTQAIAVVSTHAPEEKLLLDSLRPLLQENKDLKLFLAPRHPERFLEVEKLFLHENFSFSKLSNVKDTQIVLIDRMGFLNRLFAVSDVAIVAGSFISKIGGHNILEPVFFQTPVFFGPYMQAQEDLKKLILKEKVGFQVDLSSLKESIKTLIKNKKENVVLKSRCEDFSLKLKANEEKSFALIKNLL